MSIEPSNFFEYQMQDKRQSEQERTFNKRAKEASADSSVQVEEGLSLAERQVIVGREALKRSKAEYEHLQRRYTEDLSKASKFAAEKFASQLLVVKDSLESALAEENQTSMDLRNGVELTLRQLVQAFTASSIQEINPMGLKFDPHFHQAISQVVVDDRRNVGIVQMVLQKGYTLNDRILRPALVIVGC